jgi:hypothetical protein
MSTPIKDGGPAFPAQPIHYFPDGITMSQNQGGMTLRDYFAGQALAGFNAQPDGGFSFHWENAKGEKRLLGYGSTPAGKDVEGWRIVKTALQAQAESMYAQADAMLAAREVQK